MAGFAIGDYACNLYWQSVSLFLLFYYTDVVHLAPATAGLLEIIVEQLVQRAGAPVEMRNVE